MVSSGSWPWTSLRSQCHWDLVAQKLTMDSHGFLGIRPVHKYSPNLRGSDHILRVIEVLVCNRELFKHSHKDLFQTGLIDEYAPGDRVKR